MIATVVYTNPITEWWWESGAAGWFYIILGGIVAAIILICFCIWIGACYEDWRNSRRK